MRIWTILAAVIFCSCSPEQNGSVEMGSTFSRKHPGHFPSVPHPKDNLPTEARRQLGEKLFFERALSKDGSVSCASCHLPEHGFADQRANSPGAFGRPGTSNAPSLWNVAYHPYYLRGASVPTLEMQVLVPIQEENEFAHNIVALSEELGSDPVYRRMSQEAYARDLDPFVITRAIAQFERSLIAGHSDYDRFINGELTAMSAAARRGMELFNSERLGCGSCHLGFNFTNYALERNGSDTNGTAEGRYRSTGIPSDYGRFKVPSLRDIAQSAPYFHDGRYADLEAVIDHYDRGGDPDAPHHPKIRPLGLSPQEKQSLMHFLHALSQP